MSTVRNFIKSLPEITNASEDPSSDINYIHKSAQLVSDALGKGSDVMQLPNGDIVVTEVKTVTYKYLWNKETHKFERHTKGNRQRKMRKVS